MADYQLERVTTKAAELELTHALLVQAFGTSAPSRETLEWQYLANPRGPAVGFSAWSEGVLAAHYVTLPVLAEVRGVRRKGLLSLNTATHPEHQKRGLFTRLAEATFQAAAEEGYEFVVGVANARSAPGFLGKLSFMDCGPLDARVGCGAWAAAALSAQSTQIADFEIIRDEEWWRWRLSRPGSDYRHGAGWLWSRTALPGVSCALSPLDENTVTQAGAGLPLEPFAGARPSIWLGRLPGAKSPGGLAIPMRLRPSPLHLIFRPLGEWGRAVGSLPSKEGFAFRAVDFDAY